MDDYITWCGSVIHGEDGRYYMFASRWPKALTMRNWVTNSEIVLASSDCPEGPFTFEQVEDPCIWKTGDTYHMVAKIFSERLTGQREAGFHATSNDGVRWTASSPPKAYDRTVRFQDGTTREQKKLERPQVLVHDGMPTHLYFATADPDWDDIYNLVIPLKKIAKE